MLGDAFATKTDGTLWGWGSNYEGRGLAQNDAIARSSPTQIGTGTDWATDDGKLSGGDKCNGCIKTDGTLWTWGANQYGSCGVNVAYNPAYPGPSPSQPAGMEGFSSPVQVPGTTWDNITSGGSCNVGPKN
jgi:alpha-tubulin suppressor-like RCC1 family protein